MTDLPKEIKEFCANHNTTPLQLLRLRYYIIKNVRVTLFKYIYEGMLRDNPEKTKSEIQQELADLFYMDLQSLKSNLLFKKSYIKKT